MLLVTRRSAQQAELSLGLWGSSTLLLEAGPGNQVGSRDTCWGHKTWKDRQMGCWLQNSISSVEAS